MVLKKSSQKCGGFFDDFDNITNTVCRSVFQL